MYGAECGVGLVLSSWRRPPSFAPLGLGERHHYCRLAASDNGLVTGADMVGVSSVDHDILRAIVKLHSHLAGLEIIEVGSRAPARLVSTYILWPVEAILDGVFIVCNPATLVATLALPMLFLIGASS